MGCVLCFQGLNVIGICCVLVTGCICPNIHLKSVVFQGIWKISSQLPPPIFFFFFLKITYQDYFKTQSHFSKYYLWTSSWKIRVQKGLHACLHIFSQLFLEHLPCVNRTDVYLKSLQQTDAEKLSKFRYFLFAYFIWQIKEENKWKDHPYLLTLTIAILFLKSGGLFNHVFCGVTLQPCSHCKCLIYTTLNSKFEIKYVKSLNCSPLNKQVELIHTAMASLFLEKAKCEYRHQM